jgi:lactate permease
MLRPERAIAQSSGPVLEYEALPTKGVDIWVQNYNPMNSWVVSTLLAAIPVLVLLGLLASGRANAWQSAMAGLAAALLVAIVPFGMPLSLATASVGYGLVFAFFRIIWLIVAAVFLYDLAVDTGQFEVMKASIARLSGDRRIQALLVAFAFGAFVEGAAGFGAPVAISAAFLVGLGFRPFQAAVLCLIANTAPVAWGAIGTPIRTLEGVTSLHVEALSQCAGRILPILSLIVPVWLVRTMVSWRETLAIWPALLTVGGTFAFVQFAWSNFVGYELVDIASSVSSILAGVILLRFWRPSEEWRFPEERTTTITANEGTLSGSSVLGHDRPGRRRVARAWMPFVFLTVAVLIWGVPSVRGWLDRHSTWKPPMPGLATGHVNPAQPAAPAAHILQSRIAKGPAVTGKEIPVPLDASDVTLSIVPVSSTGSAIFLAAIVSAAWLGVGPSRFVRLLLGTIHRLRWAMVAILAMLSLGFVTKFSGMDAVLGLAFTRVGPGLYPIFGTLLGWLGVALTGSDTSSNVLFGGLQRLTAEKLGLNPILMASANSTGGVMGKMIDAQSIVVAAAATGEAGKEGLILRAVFGHSICLALIVGAIVWIYAHIFPNAVPALATPPSAASQRQ